MSKLTRKCEDEQKIVQELTRELVERLGADAMLVVWTGRFSRKTYVNAATWGNDLAVDGLKRWVHEQVEESMAEDEDEEDDE
jgi:hypothetical protein